MAHTSDHYYVPHGSHWPIVASVALFTGVIGAANWFNGHSAGQMILFLGLAPRAALAELEGLPAQVAGGR